MQSGKHPVSVHHRKEIAHHSRFNLANHQSKSHSTQISISQKITLKEYPEIILLKKADEPDDVMQRLGYEEILIRWLNYHIKKNGGNREIKNLGSDMVDGYAYGNLLQSIGTSVSKQYFDFDQDRKAVEVIETCKRDGFKPPIGA